MKKARPPQNEADRIAALKRFAILDTAPDTVLDNITQAAADLCETPYALISLVDTKRQWFKSSIGLPVRETPRDLAFCSHAILEPGELMEVEDASQDERFHDNPLVTGEPLIRFYAGKPLVTSDGFALGTLCVIDDKPRQLSPTQRNGLSRLAQAVVDLFSERLRYRTSALDHIIEQAVQHGVLITDPNQPDNPITYANEAVERMTGYARDEFLGRNCRFLQGPGTDPDSVKHLRETIAQHKPCTITLKNYRKDGSVFWNELTVSPVRASAGNLKHCVGITHDVSAKLETESRLRQAQKIEAIGQLSGGIAHDFNNLLSVITGNLEFLAMGNTDEDQRELINEADRAAQMGARLTRRLLTFAKQNPLEPTVLHANEHVLNAIELLRSTIRENVSLSSQLCTDLWSTRADPSEVENTVVNLVINARDAMPNGGKVNIETKNVSLTQDDIEDGFRIAPGDYIQLSVSDTGSGMTDEVKARLFEPFFTTKELGKSTGLGLASIYGFAQQSGGDVHVYSEVGHGTVISVYLPRHIESFVNTPEVQSVKVQPTKAGTRVLVVEDNDMVRKVTVKRLQALKYDTIQASNGPEAIQMLENDAGFDLILTDIVMDGGMSGYDVAQWVQSNLPQCKILLTSGFNEQMAEASDVVIEQLRVLQKPYSLAELQQAVNGALERKLADA